MKWLSIIGLALNLIAALLLAYSLHIEESDMGGVGINVRMVNGEVVSQAKFSYVEMRVFPFYSGVACLAAGFLFQFIGLLKKE